MKIERFAELLREKHPHSTAYVRRLGTVDVVYSASSKAYSYTGTIIGVATRLHLIPEIDVDAESAQIADNLPATGHVESPEMESTQCLLKK